RFVRRPDFPCRRGPHGCTLEASILRCGAGIEASKRKQPPQLRPPWLAAILAQLKRLDMLHFVAALFAVALDEIRAIPARGAERAVEEALADGALAGFLGGGVGGDE